MTREIFFVRETCYLSFIWGVHITKAYTNPQKDFVSSLKYIYQKRGLHKFNKNDFCSGNNLCIMCSTHPNINCILSILHHDTPGYIFTFSNQRNGKQFYCFCWILVLFQFRSSQLWGKMTRTWLLYKKKRNSVLCSWG